MGKIRTRKGSPYLQGEWYDDKGDFHRKSLKTTDRKVARRRLREYERGHQADPGPNHTLAEALEHLVNVALAHRRPATRDYHTKKARHLVRLLAADLDLADLSREMLQHYVAQRNSEGAHPHTISKELGTLKQTLREAAMRGLWLGDARVVVPTVPKGYEPKDRHLTPSEWQRLELEIPPKRRLWVALALHGGCRAGEVTSARWENVNLQTGWMIVDGKTGRRSVRISDELAHHLRFAERDSGPVVERWHNQRRDLGDACRRAAVEPAVTANDLRRTFASWLIQSGVPNFIVAQLLGHKTTAMVDRVYGRVTSIELDTAFAQCAKYVRDNGERGSTAETLETPKVESSALKLVPRDRIELPTRGFSVDVSKPIKVRTKKVSG